MSELSTLGAVIKTAYEKQSNTNAYTDADKTKVSSAVESSDLAPYAKTADVPTSPGDIGAATAAQGQKADSAVQPAALGAYAKTADLP